MLSLTLFIVKTIRNQVNQPRVNPALPVHAPRRHVLSTYFSAPSKRTNGVLTHQKTHLFLCKRLRAVRGDKARRGTCSAVRVVQCPMLVLYSVPLGRWSCSRSWTGPVVRHSVMFRVLYMQEYQPIQTTCVNLYSVLMCRLRPCYSTFKPPVY